MQRIKRYLHENGYRVIYEMENRIEFLIGRGKKERHYKIVYNYNGLYNYFCEEIGLDEYTSRPNEVIEWIANLK